MKGPFLIVGVLVAVVAGWGTLQVLSQKTPPCPDDIKICLDGSHVSRVAPRCEFATCSGVATSTVGTDITPYPSYTTGVEGTVLVGPTCPVQRIPPDPACADKGYATAIVVYHTGSTTPFILGNTDVQGEFKLPLPPGAYILQATGGTVLPRCASVQVTVPSTGYAKADISCDSGIR